MDDNYQEFDPLAEACRVMDGDEAETVEDRKDDDTSSPASLSVRLPPVRAHETAFDRMTHGLDPEARATAKQILLQAGYRLDDPVAVVAGFLGWLENLSRKAPEALKEEWTQAAQRMEESAHKASGEFAQRLDEGVNATLGEVYKSMKERGQLLLRDLEDKKILLEKDSGKRMAALVEQTRRETDARLRTLADPKQRTLWVATALALAVMLCSLGFAAGYALGNKQPPVPQAVSAWQPAQGNGGR